MIEYRTFLNTDTPVLAGLWNSQAPHPLRLRHTTVKLWDELPLGKLDFDPFGFWVAEAGNSVVGFVHASVLTSPPEAVRPAIDLPSEVATASSIATDHGHLEDDPAVRWGAIHQLVLAPATAPVWTTLGAAADSTGLRAQVAEQLIRCGLEYFEERGVSRLVAGGVPAMDPFYLGFHGGSQTHGLLTDDHELRTFFEHAGFQATGGRVIRQRSLAGFRPPVDRQQLNWKRCATATWGTDLNTASPAAMAPVWPSRLSPQQSAALGTRDRYALAVEVTGAGSRFLQLGFWDMQPLACEWGLRAAGLLEAHWDEQAWSDGLALFAVAESLRQLQQRGIDLVEIQSADDDPRWRGLTTSLGFSDVATSTLLMRQDSC